MEKTYRERLNRSFGKTLLDTPVPNRKIVFSESEWIEIKSSQSLARASGTNKIRPCSETENTKIPSPSTSFSAKIKAT